MVAEYIGANQSVGVGSNVSLDATVRPYGCSIIHRDGSGTVSLRGRERYIVTFSANISGTAGTQLAMAIAIDGEPVQSAVMNSVSTVAGNLNNISASIVVDVPCGCCSTVSVENIGTIATTVDNASLVIEGM